MLHWYLSRPVEEQVALPKLDQSFVTACFTPGLEVRPGRAWNEGYRGVIKEVFQDKFTNYPFIHRSPGDYQSITVVAQLYITNITASTWTPFVGRQLDYVRFWLREHGLESPDVSAKRVQCLINGWITPRTDNQAGAGGGGTGGGGGGGALKVTATARAGASATAASTAATAAAARAAARVAAARAREEARARASAGGRCGKGGGGGGRPVGQIPDEVQDFINEERRLLRLEGSTRLDVNEKTPVEGLLLPYLYHILYQYHQMHPAVLAVQEGMGDKPEMQAEHGGNPGYRAFTIAPICSIKRHFMTLDTRALGDLLKNVMRRRPTAMTKEAWSEACPDWLRRLGGMSPKRFCRDAVSVKEMWDETFRVGGLRNQRVFHNRVSTDGVSVSVFFHVAKERLKREKAERVRVEKEDEEKEMLERQQGQENLQPVRERRIVAIDPGRVNLVTALDSQTGKIKTLTRRAYYGKRRINECKRKFSFWEDALGDINAAFSRTTMKTVPTCVALTGS